jgi:hypothetical protein
MKFEFRDANGSLIEQRSSPSRAVARFELTLSDAAVAKAMRLLAPGAAMNWVELYRLYGVIEANVGGQRALSKLQWESDTNLRRFRHSANSVQVAGDASRHGEEPGKPPASPMTLEEAEACIKRMLDKWLASKGV